MEITLERNFYAFSAGEETAAVVTVTTGELDYSGQTSGPFVAAGSIAAGETRQFNEPTIVAATRRTVFDISFPGPLIPEPQQPAPPVEPEES